MRALIGELHGLVHDRRHFVFHFFKRGIVQCALLAQAMLVNRDPITIYEHRLREKGALDDATFEEMENEVATIVNEAVQFADQSPHPDVSEMYKDVLAEKYPLQK